MVEVACAEGNESLLGRADADLDVRVLRPGAAHHPLDADRRAVRERDPGGGGEPLAAARPVDEGTERAEREPAARVLAEERHAPRDAHRTTADRALHTREHPDLGGERRGGRRADGGVGRRGGVVDELGHGQGPPVRRKGRSGTTDGP